MECGVEYSGVEVRWVSEVSVAKKRRPHKDGGGLNWATAWTASGEQIEVGTLQTLRI